MKKITRLLLIAQLWLLERSTPKRWQLQLLANPELADLLAQKITAANLALGEVRLHLQKRLVSGIIATPPPPPRYHGPKVLITIPPQFLKN